MNGRTLTDCTSFAAMSQDTLGHTRAVFTEMEDMLDLPEHQLEFGRSVNQLHGMDMLDSPPENWSDFVLTAFLAENAVGQFFHTFKGGNVEAFSGMVDHFAKEAYFHLLNIEGWLQELDEEELAELKEAIPRRMPAALAWFGSKEAAEADPLVAAGVRGTSIWQARQNFVEMVLNKLAFAGIDDATIETMLATGEPDQWDARRRRTSATELPAGLWELMMPTSDAAVATRRPLAVSVKDSIDLFERPDVPDDMPAGSDA